jgi:hypothetical protein
MNRSNRLYAEYESSEGESDSDESGYTSEESLLNVPGKAKPIQTGVPVPPREVPKVLPKGEFKAAESKNSQLFVINSRDRDTEAFPQPTFFKLRLPRVYKNVKSVNISQFNLLNSFFNFTDKAQACSGISKGNTFMYVYELGRTKLQNGVDISNAIKVSIRNGTYNTTDLVTELTNALNSTPLFADITPGEFISFFQGSGDFTPLFNTPGPTVFNSFTQTYDRNQSINDIVARYFTIVQNVGTVSFSFNQCLVAYYYPVIKEMMIAQPNPVPFETFGLAIPPGFDSWYNYLVFAFQGLDDPFVTRFVIDPANQEIFNNFRAQNTFNNFLVNQYTCTYNTKQGRLVITAPSLNPSITSDLNQRYTLILNNLVLSNNFGSIAEFQAAYNSINNSNGALLEIYNYIQTRFTSNFGINFGQYSAEFYANPNNQVTVYDTLNSYGWNTLLTPEVSASVINSNPPPLQIEHLWKGIQFSTGVPEAASFFSTVKVPEFSTIAGDEYLNFNGASESQYGYADVYFRNYPTTYNRVAFHSRCRQNISFMTLPRRADQRQPGTEETFNMNVLQYESTATFNSQPPGTPFLYDKKSSDVVFIRTDISGNLLFNLYTVNMTMFESAAYMRNFNVWLSYMTTQIQAGIRVQRNNPLFGTNPPALDINLSSFRPFLFFQLNADKYLVEPNAHFDVEFYVETQDGSQFTVPLALTWYKDRAAFMADAAKDLENNFESENPRHYFRQDFLSPTANSHVMKVDVNNSQVTYFMLHLATTATIPSQIPIRVFCVLADPYGTNYRLAVPNDFIDLPYPSITSTFLEQVTPTNPIFASPLKDIYTFPSTSLFQLGYDISGVSNNVLDYIINAANNIYYDPNNIEDYISLNRTGLQYQLNWIDDGAPQPPPNVGTTGWSLYFGSNQTGNVIRDTFNTTSNIYLVGGQAPKPFDTTYGTGTEALLVNWFNPRSNIRELYYQPLIGSGAWFAARISTMGVFQPAINPDQPLGTDMVTFPTYHDTTGFSGLGFFLPPDDIVRVDTMLVKFVYTQPSADSNSVLFTRTNSPLNPAIYPNEAAQSRSQYRNQTTYTTRPTNDFDDWFLYNRRNVKLGVFKTCDVVGINISTLKLSDAITSLTLTKVTQVNQYEHSPGSTRTREPEWGTYYTYQFENPRSTIGMWNVTTPAYASTTSNYFQYVSMPPDFAPTFVADSNSYSNYFVTQSTIKDYSYQPRTIGIAPSIGLLSSQTVYQENIQYSYTAIPFYYDQSTSSFRVGSFFGASFTSNPAYPEPTKIGAAPYYGPPGIYAWQVSSSTSTLQLHNGPFSNFQPYYFNTKVSFQRLDLDYDPATDLSLFGGISSLSNEYQDTVMFIYSNATPFADSNDVYADSITYRWGLESAVNYTAFDDNSGYNYLSYIHDKPVRPGNEYAVHVRGYDPIPSFMTGIRFIGKNHTDFGTLSLNELCDEINSIQGYRPIDVSTAASLVQNPVEYSTFIGQNDAIRDNTSNFYSHPYADALIKFDKSFVGSTIFGRKLGFSGFTIGFSGYCDALNKYTQLYSSIRNIFSLYTSVFSTATGELNQYTTARYGNILPSTILNRNRITDPLPFSLLFGTYTLPPYNQFENEWGLGWNLGFQKKDTFPAVIQTSQTFIRIIDDYIYLRLNPEINLNALAVSAKENLSQSRETQGEESKYFAKIILNNFGGFCRTAIQLPKNFTPYLNKFDTLSCQLVDRNGSQIDNQDCEFDFVLEVQEMQNDLVRTDLGPSVK